MGRCQDCCPDPSNRGGYLWAAPWRAPAGPGPVARSPQLVGLWMECSPSSLPGMTCSHPAAPSRCPRPCVFLVLLSKAQIKTSKAL